MNMSVQNSVPEVFKKTESFMQRKVLVDKKAIYFRDNFCGVTSKKLDLVPFSLRLFKSTIVETKKTHFLFKNEENSSVLLVSRNDTDHLELKAKPCSSKGRIQLWNITSETDTDKTINIERLIMPGNRVADYESGKYEQEFECYLQKFRSNF